MSVVALNVGALFDEIAAALKILNAFRDMVQDDRDLALEVERSGGFWGFGWGVRGC